ncbi:MAG: ABC transporter permease [Actinomycetaceae bacterium]|nr:ABC transporter permease [Actinomycetaceae bacterium]
MIRQARICMFFLRQFLSVPYFIQLMAMTTIATTLVHYAAYTAWGSITPTQGWVRGGVIGMWTVTTTAAGIVGFERYKGTLVCLVLAPIGTLRVLAALVASAALAGLGSFPLAWLTWAVASGSWEFAAAGAPDWLRLIAGALLLFVGCLSMSLSISALFVLTPHAIAYEELLLVPVFIASGILSTASRPGWIDVVSRMLPLRFPFDLMWGAPVTLGGFTAWVGVCALWFLLAYAAGTRALHLATRSGTLEVM